MNVRKKVERLAVSVSGVDTNQLLAISKLYDSKAVDQADVIVSLLEDWQIADKIGGMVFDTTNTNTGADNGICALIEEALGIRELINFACRHHVHEVVLKALFEKCMGTVMSGPDVPLFKRFKADWDEIDKSNYQSGIEEAVVSESISDAEKNEILSFAKDKLQVHTKLLYN